MGPLRDKPGYDPMMQAYSGLMSLLGEDGRPPVRVPASIIDMGAGMWSVIGILAALQERGRTGKGGIVDTSLYETGLAWMSIYLAGYLANRELPARHGSGVDMIVPYQAFAAADGYMMVAAGNDNLFRRLAAVLDRPGLAEDPRFRSNKDRVVNRKELVPILSDIFATKPRAEWARLLDAAGHPERADQHIGPGRRRRADAGARHHPDQTRQRTRPRRPAAVVRRHQAGIRKSGAGTRRRQREARPVTTRAEQAAAALLLMAALAGCGGGAGTPTGGVTASGREPTAIAVSTEQGGRFIGLTGPQRQHAEPFLGVAGTNFYTLRTWIDRRTGETVHQLYVSDSYAGQPRDWYAARDAQGRPLRFIPISRNEITCQPGCSYAEEFAAAIPEAELRNATGGLTVTFTARSGTQKTIAVPGELVKAQVTALDRVRAGLATAATVPPAAPARP